MRSAGSGSSARRWPRGGGPGAEAAARRPQDRIDRRLRPSRWYAGQAISSPSRTAPARAGRGPFKVEDRARRRGTRWPDRVLKGGKAARHSFLPASDECRAGRRVGSGGSTPAALCPAMMGWDVFADWAYEGGAFSVWRHVVGHEDGGGACPARGRCRGLHRDAGGGQEPAASRGAHGLAGGAAALPYTHYGDWIGNPAPRGYWDRISPKAALPVALPTCRCSMSAGGTTKARRHARRLAGDGRLARAERLVVGPWGHIPWGRRTGIVISGPRRRVR